MLRAEKWAAYGPFNRSCAGPILCRPPGYFGHHGCQHIASDGYHLPSGWQRSIEQTPLAQVFVFTDHTGAQAAAIFLPRAMESDVEPVIASAAIAATSAIFEVSLIMFFSSPSEFSWKFVRPGPQLTPICTVRRRSSCRRKISERAQPAAADRRQQALVFGDGR